ncbi:MAG: sensor histidine kinase [Lachnospiraceae bacterium]|nr:sensor histidine kinase [Lachnospiraceae bacterium]
MDGKQYLKNKFPVILINLLGMLFLAAFLAVNGSNVHSILFILIVWTLVLCCYLAAACFLRKRYLDKLLTMTQQLEERYLIAEITTRPERADDAVFIDIMKMAEKSMLEKIGRIEKERREYKEYIEQWIHEAKTPIAAMKLLCENNRCDFTRELLAELEHVNHYTEQALYFARSEHTEKDYMIRETDLADVIHSAVADNKYLLRQNAVAVTVDQMNEHVYTDDKWLRFILNQMIGNAVKYRGKQPAIHFYAMKRADMVSLMVEDNGIGIVEGDLPRIFDKGFTGSNGRTVQSSTGIGLYLCKKLCDKLGIGLEVLSKGEGTKVVLSFHINDFIAEVQS